MYYKSLEAQPSEADRARMLEKFAREVWEREGPGEIRYRLRSPVDYATVDRLWSGHMRRLDNESMKDIYTAERRGQQLIVLLSFVLIFFGYCKDCYCSHIKSNNIAFSNVANLPIFTLFFGQVQCLFMRCDV